MRSISEMKPLTIAITAGVILAGASNANAVGYLTGRELYDRCQLSLRYMGPKDIHTPEDVALAAKGAVCVAYIRGAADALDLVSRVLPERSTICIPLNTSGGELRDEVMKYIYRNADKIELDKDASGIVVNALIARWKCKPN
jgi:hypothetical protein